MRSVVPGSEARVGTQLAAPLCLVIAGVVLLAAGCWSEPDVAPIEGPVPQAGQIHASWVWTSVFDKTVDEEVFGVAARRWLGPATDGQLWAAPGAEVTSHPGLARRLVGEDARALGHLRSLYLHAVCRLGQTPQSFGTQIPEGFLVAAAACEALGEGEAMARATAYHEAAAGSTSDDLARLQPRAGVSKPGPGGGSQADVAALLVPKIREIELHGQKLAYPLLLPQHFDQALDLLQSQLTGPAPGEPEGSMTDTIAAQVGTSRWLAPGASAPPGLLPTAESLFAAAPKGQGRMAHLEKEVESAIQRWRAGLVQLPVDGSGGLDAAGRALLERWFRRALYRDLGLLALDGGEAELALVNLEEAAEARGRVRPSAGLDPLLLIGLARARYESNELNRAVELLDDIGRVPGWEVAGHVARTVARVAVVGSAAEAKVSR
ncbi:MAG TPA: hypothetical protein DIU15_20905 [Deltaproteobacteria bacterium]|nr:hypothetical protein [Deltaproteobacteria bacterium]